MKQTMLQEKYPVFSLDLPKTETKYQNCDEIIAYLKTKVDEHDIATYIADFDHYAHTSSLEDGVLEEGLIAARNIVFCFGIALPKAVMMAVRPRSIGVAEYADHFVISFLEAPMPMANQAMESWAKSLVN
jgi:hypothetical protein